VTQSLEEEEALQAIAKCTCRTVDSFTLCALDQPGISSATANFYPPINDVHLKEVQITEALVTDVQNTGTLIKTGVLRLLFKL